MGVTNTASAFGNGYGPVARRPHAIAAFHGYGNPFRHKLNTAHATTIQQHRTRHGSSLSYVFSSATKSVMKQESAQGIRTPQTQTGPMTANDYGNRRRNDPPTSAYRHVRRCQRRANHSIQKCKLTRERQRKLPTTCSTDRKSEIELNKEEGRTEERRRANTPFSLFHLLLFDKPGHLRYSLPICLIIRRIRSKSLLRTRCPQTESECRATLINHLILETHDIDEAENLTDRLRNRILNEPLTRSMKTKRSRKSLVIKHGNDKDGRAILPLARQT